MLGVGNRDGIDGWFGYVIGVKTFLELIISTTRIHSFIHSSFLLVLLSLFVGNAKGTNKDYRL